MHGGRHPFTGHSKEGFPQVLIIGGLSQPYPCKPHMPKATVKTRDRVLVGPVGNSMKRN
jgi:hypothetical protein